LQVQDSKRTGAGLIDIYMPSLLYFEYLKFLNEKENSNISRIDTIDFRIYDEVMIYYNVLFFFIYLLKIKTILHNTFN